MLQLWDECGNRKVVQRSGAQQNFWEYHQFARDSEPEQCQQMASQLTQKL